MSFKSIEIRSSYESGVGDIVLDFYEPVLSEAVLYDRISGFFTSTSLAVAARGMAQFIKNGGIIRLITSPILSKEDKTIIERVLECKEDVTAEELGLDLHTIEDELMNNHVKAFGWLLAHNKIDVRLAILLDEKGTPIDKDNLLSAGLFHQKIGLLTDVEGNHISFSGSINETASAWTQNDEEFKVFKDWDDSCGYYSKDKESFNNIWEGRKQNVVVVDLPSAVKRELIEYSKDFDVESISAKEYVRKKRERVSSFELDGISLFYYQKDALERWKSSGFNMLFEMATGSGKTRTAIAGMNFLMHKHEKTIAVIACPQNALAKQWKENEVSKFNLSIDKQVVIDGTIPQWKKALSTILLENAVGFANHCIIYTTHKTASSDDFVRIVSENVSRETKLIFIGDEVHWLGARKLRKALMPAYDYRIGLSATPSRWFDDAGTKFLADYFGNSHFEFTIKDALSEVNPLTGLHFLVDYFYYITRISLTEKESSDYEKLTEKLSRLFRVKDNDEEAAEKYDRYLEQRANIVKNAENKYQVLDEILDELTSNGEMENTIIFVSPQQKERVLSMLEDRGIIHHQLTQEEGNSPRREYNGLTQRQHIIKMFKEGRHKVLVAIKCLDEGIDIPSACRGILMASSTNPREYVQRIGRIIRQDQGKAFAYLYDICVDSTDALSDEYSEIESRIRRNEQRRMKEIAENAINSVDALNHILELN